MKTLIILLLLVSTSTGQMTVRTAAQSPKGMVVCVCPIAAQVGMDALKAGGNAVDAAVAVAFAEAVTWPEAGNIGGGGFMMVWTGKDATCFDYRETAPALATKTMFADGTDWPSPKSAGVPGTVSGLAMAHAKFGKLPWKDLVTPAVKLARDGFKVEAALATGLNKMMADPKTTNAEFKRVYGKPGGKWAAGDTIVLPDLATTLAAIAESPDAFYTGTTADLVDKDLRTLGGLIRKSDLAAYLAKERVPVRGTYRGCEVIGAPPPSSGGTTLVLALNMLENYSLTTVRQHPATIHLLAEVQRRAYVERARHLGDPDFNQIPDRLLDKDHAKNLCADIDVSHATKSLTLAPELNVKEGSNTTHFSIVDNDGMAVSNTYTLENAFGNRIVPRGTGFILNNEMTDFNTHPGTTNTAGKIGTPANDIVPGKRMLSSMCPVFVTKDGQLLLVTGSPGGRTIINTVMSVIVNVVDFRMDVQAAVDEPRQHHQWFPDRLQLERAKSRPELVKQLEKLGHTVTTARQGDAHTIWIDPKTGMRHGAADSRINGKAIGE